MTERQQLTETERLELEAGRAHFEAVLRGMLDPVVTIDSMGTIQDANESCHAVFGYAPDELIGQNIKLLMPEPYHSEHDGYLAHYRRTGVTGILNRIREFPAVKKSGAPIWIELSVSRIDVPGSDVPVFCGSFRDVTARKIAEDALAESERRFHAIFDSEYQFVGLLKPDGVLIEANRASLDLLGAERSEVVGRMFWDTPWWPAEEQKEQLRDAIERAARGEFVRFETDHPRRQGGIVHIDFSIKPIRDEEGEITLLLPEGRDITEIKRALQRETAIMRSFAQIGESASLLAHEIKNPVTAINAALRAVAKQLGEDERAILEDLVERMRKVEKLMRRTLSLARPLELERAPCSAAELLQSVVDLLRDKARESDVTLEFPDADREDVLVDVDRERIEEVLSNLVGNAIEALEEGGRVRLEILPGTEHVLLRVQDDGPGIPAAIVETLFKPYVSTKSQGTGLGLAIARKIAEAHDGTLDLGSGFLGGACFELRLPRPRA